MSRLKFRLPPPYFTVMKADFSSPFSVVHDTLYFPLKPLNFISPFSFGSASKFVRHSFSTSSESA